MLYVSHRLEEVFSISDRVTITRNGRDVLTRESSALTIPEVIEGMIGQQREAGGRHHRLSLSGDDVDRVGQWQTMLARQIVSRCEYL